MKFEAHSGKVSENLIHIKRILKYEVHFKSNADSGTKPTQCALKKY